MSVRHPTPTTEELQRELEALREQVEALSDSIQALVKAWENATFLVAVIKWIGRITVTLSALWYVVTHFGEGK